MQDTTQIRVFTDVLCDISLSLKIWCLIQCPLCSQAKHLASWPRSFVVFVQDVFSVLLLILISCTQKRLYVVLQLAGGCWVTRTFRWSLCCASIGGLRSHRWFFDLLTFTICFTEGPEETKEEVALFSSSCILFKKHYSLERRFVFLIFFTPRNTKVSDELYREVRVVRV